MSEFVPGDIITALRYHFSQVTALKIVRSLGTPTPKAYSTARDSFVTGLAATIKKIEDGSIPDSKEIARQQLQEMLDVATNADWTKPGTTRRLCDMYFELTGEQFQQSIEEWHSYFI